MPKDWPYKAIIVLALGPTFVVWGVIAVAQAAIEYIEEMRDA